MRAKPLRVGRFQVNRHPVGELQGALDVRLRAAGKQFQVDIPPERIVLSQQLDAAIIRPWWGARTLATRPS